MVVRFQFICGKRFVSNKFLFLIFLIFCIVQILILLSNYRNPSWNHHQNSTMINHKSNSDFNIHIILRGTQEELVALLYSRVINRKSHGLFSFERVNSKLYYTLSDQLYLDNFFFFRKMFGVNNLSIYIYFIFFYKFNKSTIKFVEFTIDLCVVYKSNNWFAKWDNIYIYIYWRVMITVQPSWVNSHSCWVILIIFYYKITIYYNFLIIKYYKINQREWLFTHASWTVIITHILTPSNFFFFF